MVIILKEGIETNDGEVINKIRLDDGEKLREEGAFCYIVRLNDKGEAETRTMVPTHNILIVT